MNIDNISEIKEEHDFTIYFHRHIQRAAVINYRLNLLVINLQIDKIIFPDQLSIKILGKDIVKKIIKQAIAIEK